ncbi:site-2 protease family protein [Sunxiuqinia sp. A32]|uniref:site-2 protease family protein n=1 Tax=Sunxiuqinia sp. A32 TaxID=3461496 RepID=UPI004045EC2D
MTAYNWKKIMDIKTDSQLEEIIKENPDSLDSEAILAAENEVKKRKKNQTFNTEPEFPEKPIPDERKQSTRKSLISFVLFIAAFYFIFKWDLQYILVLTGVILIHELGHFFAMRFYKYKDLSIFFIPLIGALASGQKEEISQKQKTIISLAGPLPGVLIGSCLTGAGLVTENDFLWRTGEIFVFLNLFNLLPVLPLDGGQILKSMFFQRNEKINIVFIWISIIVISLIALKQESYILLVIPFFLLLQIKNQTEMRKFKVYIKNKGFDIDRDFSALSNVEYWTLRDEIALNIKAISNMLKPKRYFPIPAENRVIDVMKQVIQKQPDKDIKVGGKILILFLWILTFLLPFVTVIILYTNGLIEL